MPHENPSCWSHRLPAVALALAGCGVATYLTLYQVGVFAHVWEPIFGDGSRRLLHSSVAKALPVPDASLGAAGYLIEAALGALGGEDRWRRRPWLVLLYGLTIAGFVAGSIGLVLAQALYFRAYCTLCLSSALISFMIAAWAWPEPLQALRWVRGNGPGERTARQCRQEPSTHRPHHQTKELPR